MNPKTSFISAVLLLALLTGCGKKEEAGEAGHEAQGPSRVKHGSKGETILALDGEAQTRIGLKIEPLAATQLSPEVKGYGRVVDPAALAALAAEVTTARGAN